MKPLRQPSEHRSPMLKQVSPCLALAQQQSVLPVPSLHAVVPGQSWVLAPGGGTHAPAQYRMCRKPSGAQGVRHEAEPSLHGVPNSTPGGQQSDSPEPSLHATSGKAPAEPPDEIDPDAPALPERPAFAPPVLVVPPLEPSGPSPMRVLLTAVTPPQAATVVAIAATRTSQGTVPLRVIGT